MAAPATNEEQLAELKAQVAHLLFQVVPQLEARLHKAEQERDEYRKLVLHLREENERLKRGLLGQKAERLPANDAQLSLMMLGLALGAEAAAAPAASAV